MAGQLKSRNAADKDRIRNHNRAVYANQLAYAAAGTAPGSGGPSGSLTSRARVVS